MFRIFISSTSRDLHGYRQAAIEVCNRLGYVPIAMEYFEAMSAGATKGSKQQLDNANVYVGIFAHRYGYIESGFEKAVTEIEFDYAQERKLDIFCFLVDPKYPWPPDAIDYRNISRLESLKANIESKYIRSYFTTIDDFANKLMKSLLEWRLQTEASRGDQADVTSRAAGTISLMPPFPALVVGRESDLDNVRSKLTAQQPDQMRRVTVIRGWPGVGKTVFVTALAHDAKLRAEFPDGLLWLSLGEQANPLTGLTTWARALGIHDADAVTSLEDMIALVRARLENRRVLLIVDDVWEVEAATAFKLAGAGCTLLFTTRFTDVARELAVTPADIYVLGQLSEANSLQLLAQIAPMTVESYPDEARQLVLDLEGLPLALRVAGRLLETEAAMGWGINDLLADLRQGGIIHEPATDDYFDPRTGTIPTVSLLLKKSTDRLDPEVRDAFAYLGAFAPKPATFDLPAMQAVWMVDDARVLARKLTDRGLLEPIIGSGRFQMHAILVMHARSLLQDGASTDAGTVPG
ncbi:MAG: NB-ARC domain-containing protein [Anaerolineae bacterium]